MYISLLIGLVLLLYVMQYPEEKDFYYKFLFVVFFLIGLSRTAFAYWQDYYYYKLIHLEPKFIVDYNANKFIISEYGHFFGYVLATLMLLIGYKALIIELMILILIQNILSVKVDDSLKHT